jgi:hypothetical protein
MFRVLRLLTYTNEILIIHVGYQNFKIQYLISRLDTNFKNQ